MAKHTTICAGIDTGKRKLDVAIEGHREQLQVENTPEGHEVLMAWLRQHRVKRVGIEASGGYEQPVVAELRHKRFVVVVFQPAQVRAYAKFPRSEPRTTRSMPLSSQPAPRRCGRSMPHPILGCCHSPSS
jgi:transposase